MQDLMLSLNFIGFLSTLFSSLLCSTHLPLHPKFGVIHNFLRRYPHPIIQVINEEINWNWSQNLSQGDATSYWPLAGLYTTDNNSGKYHSLVNFSSWLPIIQPASHPLADKLMEDCGKSFTTASA